MIRVVGSKGAPHPSGRWLCDVQVCSGMMIIVIREGGRGKGEGAAKAAEAVIPI